MILNKVNVILIVSFFLINSAFALEWNKVKTKKLKSGKWAVKVSGKATAGTKIKLSTKTLGIIDGEQEKFSTRTLIYKKFGKQSPIIAKQNGDFKFYLKLVPGKYRMMATELMANGTSQKYLVYFIVKKSKVAMKTKLKGTSKKVAKTKMTLLPKAQKEMKETASRYPRIGEFKTYTTVALGVGYSLHGATVTFAASTTSPTDKEIEYSTDGPSTVLEVKSHFAERFGAYFSYFSKAGTIDATSLNTVTGESSYGLSAITLEGIMYPRFSTRVAVLGALVNTAFSLGIQRNTFPFIIPISSTAIHSNIYQVYYLTLGMHLEVNRTGAISYLINGRFRYPISSGEVDISNSAGILSMNGNIGMNIKLAGKFTLGLFMDGEYCSHEVSGTYNGASFVGEQTLIAVALTARLGLRF